MLAWNTFQTTLARHLLVESPCSHLSLILVDHPWSGLLRPDAPRGPTRHASRKRSAASALLPPAGLTAPDCALLGHVTARRIKTSGAKAAAQSARVPPEGCVWPVASPRGSTRSSPHGEFAEAVRAGFMGSRG